MSSVITADRVPAITRGLLSLAVAALLATPLAAGAGSTTVPRVKQDPPSTPPAANFPDKTGQWANFPAAPPSQTGPFFAALGANGRTCATCHAPNDAWTATPGALQKRFAATNGADAIFLGLDGTNCPTLPTATVSQHQAASSLLLTSGLIRVELTPPASADFTVASVSNPYGCGSTTAVSVYRRILATTNLSFLSTVMWDGRETAAGSTVYADLIRQATDAVKNHAAATQSELAAAASSITASVGFELGQYTAQQVDTAAGSLTAPAPGGLVAATGGAANVAQQPFTAGENSASLAPTVFTVFKPWESIAVTASSPAAVRAQASIGRGESLFNSMPFTITNVAGLNDVPGPNGASRKTLVGTCGTCHNSSNAGSHSSVLLVDEGQAHRAVAGLPSITLVSKTTKATVTVTDPGAALATGKFADIGKFKVPTLRGLAARAPYFHDGSAHSLDDVVNFYNTRFNLNLSATQHADLVAFLSAL